MKVLLTGATGAVGSGILQAFVDHGHEVTCPVRSLSKIPNPDSNPLIHYVEIDASVDDYTKFNRLAQGFNCIIHTGFVMSANDAEPESNILRGLLDAAKNQANHEKVNFIYTTGCLLYGSMDRVIPDDEASTANAVPFLSFRLAHEQQAMSASSENLVVSVIRPVFVYGGSHIDTWFSACKKNGKILVPEGNGRICLIHKEDLGQFYRLVAEKNGSGYYCAGEDAGTDVADLIELAKRITGVDVVERVSDVWPHIQTYTFSIFGFSLYQAIEPKRGKLELGFEPKYQIMRDAERVIRFD